MPTPNERRALLFVATIAALGLGARAVRGHFTARTAAGGDVIVGATADAAAAALDRQIEAVDSATAVKRGRGRGTKGRAVRGGARGAAPALARDSSAVPSRNAFRGTATTPGAPHGSGDPLALYEARRAAVAEQNRATQARIEGDRAAEARLDADRVAKWRVEPRAAPRAASTAGGAASAGDAPAERVDLDTAGPDELAALPWIGAGLAARIVSDRAIRGPFGSLAALQRVRGIGPGLAARIAPFVRFSRPDSRLPEVIRFRPVRVRPPRP